VIEATPVGVDLGDVWRQWILWRLVDPEEGVIRFVEPGSEAHQAISHVAHLYLIDCKDENIWAGARAWIESRVAAEAATRAAAEAEAGAEAGAARAGARVAVWAAAEVAARVAAWAARAAESAGWAARATDAVVAWVAAYAADSAGWAEAAARVAAYQVMARKLLQLLKEAS
jgi:hypothetical protein